LKTGAERFSPLLPGRRKRVKVTLYAAHEITARTLELERANKRDISLVEDTRHRNDVVNKRAYVKQKNVSTPE